MQLDPETCYRAMVSRDRRFEGRFVVAVRSTGIYCRPGCPAKTPHKRNVHFYAHAAAAEQAGFRPCLRCRPESAPGTPAWLGTSATVARALRLIVDGEFADGERGERDQRGVEALAARLGIGARHLTRLFAEHVGVAPGAVARTRRVHFARKLLDETDLPMAEVALAAGFSSVRRFNEAMRQTFRRAPTELRRSRANPRGSSLRLKLPYRAPLDWPAFRAFLGARSVAGVETFDGDVWRRAVAVDGWSGVVSVAPLASPRGESALELTLDGPPPRALLPIVERVTRVFDLDADPRVIGDELARDPILRPLVRARPGLRVPGAWDGFELAVRAILGQQISVARATALAAKLVAACGAPLDAGHGLTRLFPTAAEVARADVAALGMPRARARSIVALAEAVARGDLTLARGRDLDETTAALTALPGIGPWTAQYIAMRALGEPDAFPSSDLGIRHALARAGLSTASEIERRAERWRPWRAYAAMQLWMGT
ncbi:MAG TPA: AlkA N-terminal domain-containing protein [Polyangia bacterium]|nr:AlkA N-terminal domain-containing protein [Polyangia bacterium]